MAEQVNAVPVRADAEMLLGRMGGREAFERSFYQRTHFPENMAANQIAEAVSILEVARTTLASAQVAPDLASAWEDRFVRLWVDYQRAGARVANWFITGPARFPVERNNKRLETEWKRGDAWLQHARGVNEWIRRKQRSAVRAELSTKAASVEHKDKAFEGGRIVLNKTLDRVQLVFDGRPDPSTIGDLKSRAFRWSPREGAWQRQLTQNGVWAAEFVVKALQQRAAA